MAPRSFRRFAYATLLSNRDPSAWHTRDGAAFAETSAALCELGWRYAGLIYNYPSSGGRPAHGPEAFEFVTADEWLVENTRPPLDDNAHSDFRFVHRSDSALERAVFAEFRRYFRVCKRARVLLTPEVGAGLAKAEFQFGVKKDARLISFNSLDRADTDTVIPHGAETDPYRTIAFFLRSSHIPDYGCGLTACFGMGGMETLIWSRVVRTRFKEWFERDVFVVAELGIAPIPKNPITLDFVTDESVTVDIILNHTWRQSSTSTRRKSVK